jgi:hypothetical protein
MTSKLLMTPMDGTPKQICFADHAGDFGPSTNNDLRITTDGSQELDVQMAMLNWADGAGIQSAKCDLGAHWAPSYELKVALEMQVAAADLSGIVFWYWAPSHSTTAAVGNPGGVSGSAGAYSGYSSDLTTAVKQLVPIGPAVLTDDAVDSLQIVRVGILRPLDRFGTLVGRNACGQTICDTDDIEAHAVLTPALLESQ